MAACWQAASVRNVFAAGGVTTTAAVAWQLDVAEDQTYPAALHRADPENSLASREMSWRSMSVTASPPRLSSTAATPPAMASSTTMMITVCRAMPRTSATEFGSLPRRAQRAATAALDTIMESITTVSISGLSCRFLLWGIQAGCRTSAPQNKKLLAACGGPGEPSGLAQCRTGEIGSASGDLLPLNVSDCFTAPAEQHCGHAAGDG